jgi:hypothetical protein
LAVALAAGAVGGAWLARQAASHESVKETTIEREIGVGIEIIPPGQD